MKTTYYVTLTLSGCSMPDRIRSFPTKARAFRAAKRLKKYYLDHTGNSDHPCIILGNIKQDKCYRVMYGNQFSHTIKVE